MATITETLAPAMETMQLKLQSKQTFSPSPQPPAGPKPKAKLRLDPLRALEPARKKLSTIETQRIMAVLTESIKKAELVAALPDILKNLDSYKTALGSDLVQLLESHRVILSSFDELKSEADRLFEKDRQEEEDQAEGDSPADNKSNAGSISSQTENAMHSLSLVAKQMQHSIKNILRAFSIQPAAVNAVLKDRKKEQTQESRELIMEMNELKEIVMGMLLTTPGEESERNQYLLQISQRERFNAGVIEKLETELQAAVDDKDAEIKKKNDVIRRLQADLHQIEKFSEEHIRRTKSEAEKQEAADVKNSEGKRQKLQQELNTLRSQVQTLISEHRESEQALRAKKFKIETEVDNWIQNYDKDMGERQDEFEEIDAVYTEEKKQLHELEERFKTLETEYSQIMEERRVARERREAQERELQMSIKAATTIQAFWRSYKVRKALKAKKKKGGGKKKKK